MGDFFQKASCHNEYGVLEKVIVVSPKYMHKNVEKKIHSETAIKQHSNFINVLKNNGVKVIYLEPKEALYEQVFTRDIGFCLGDNLFVATMGNAVRTEEEVMISDWFTKNQYSFNKIESPSIEGGDVIIDERNIWVGVSDRTSETAIQKLRKKLKNYHIHSLPLAEKILHLDCAFNVLSKDIAIVYPQALTKKDLQLLKQHYELIEITEEEQSNLATNVLSIGYKKIVSLTQNRRINNVLKGKGFKVMDVDFSEIIKFGGSFRCCSLPLKRG